MKRVIFIAVLLLATTFAARSQDTANGVFLVAQPTLDDPTFRRTVILITQLTHVGAGPIGVIVNRATDISLSAVFSKHKHIAAQPQRLYFGGPIMQQELMLLVRADTPPPRSIAVLQDVYLMADVDWVEGALSNSNALSAVRVFAGHSGWAPGQLQNELEREGWYVLPADSATIFETEVSSIWPELVKRAVLRPTSINKIQ